MAWICSAGSVNSLLKRQRGLRGQKEGLYCTNKTNEIESTHELFWHLLIVAMHLGPSRYCDSTSDVWMHPAHDREARPRVTEANGQVCSAFPCLVRTPTCRVGKLDPGDSQTRRFHGWVWRMRLTIIQAPLCIYKSGSPRSTAFFSHVAHPSARLSIRFTYAVPDRGATTRAQQSR